MVKIDIVVNDDNYQGTYAEKYADIGNELDQIVTDYVKILKSVVEASNGGTLKGSTADKLLEYANMVEEIFRGFLTPVFLHKKNLMNSFVEKIDEADENLY